MPARYRLMLWLDQAGNPESCALARYVEDVKVSEDVWPAAPFDTVAECFAMLMGAVDIQQPLWHDAGTSGRRQEGALSHGSAPSSSSDEPPSNACLVCWASRDDVPAVTDESGPGDDSAD